MSDASSSTAWAMIELTSLMTGASSADSRISVTSATSASPSSTASATASSSRLMRPIRRLDVVGRGHHRLHLVPGHSLRSSRAITFDGSEIATRRRPRSSKPIGARVQPARRLRAEQVERRQVDLEAGQVDVAEAEALRGRARQLVAGHDLVLEQHLLGGAARLLGPGDRGVHGLRSAKPSSAITAGIDRDIAMRRGGVSPSTASSAEASSGSVGPPGTARSADPPGSSLIARPRPLG